MTKKKQQVTLYTENFLFKTVEFRCLKLYKHELISSGFKKPSMLIICKSTTHTSYSFYHQVNFLAQLQSNGLLSNEGCASFAKELARLWTNYYKESKDELTFEELKRMGLKLEKKKMIKITNKDKIKEVLRDYMLECNNQPAPFVYSISAQSPRHRGGIIFEGARPISTCTEINGEVTYALSNRDTNFSVSIGTVKLSEIKYIEVFEKGEL